jgi:hypothetical protein
MVWIFGEGFLEVSMRLKHFPLGIKMIVYQVIFLILHYLYDWFPNRITMLISGVDESVYQHMKIGFFSFLIFVAIEFLFSYKTIESISHFIIVRLFSASYLPLVMMVIYLIGPLLFGQFESTLAEIIFANIALLMTSMTTFIVQNQIVKMTADKGFVIVVISLFVISFAQFILFTFHLPWFDIFAIPPGW